MGSGMAQAEPETQPRAKTMTFQPYELAVYAAILFFILLGLACFCYCAGFRAGRLAGMQNMFNEQQRRQTEHERIKRAITHPRSDWDL